MHVFRKIEDLSEEARGATLVLGSFDGVHRGHAALISAARVHPHRVGVLTFSPHPRLLVQAAQPPFLLTPGREKHAALQRLGVDLCVELPFTREFASVAAEDFVAHILVEGLAAKHLIVGDNFRFGAGRKGDAALLQELGASSGFTVERIASVLDENGQAYSSTRIRECLRAGDLIGAAAILGRPWSIQLSIQDGLGGERASFHFGERLKPLAGLYSVRLRHAEALPVEAHLSVSQDDDIGRLELGPEAVLYEADGVTLEFVDFLGPLTTKRLRGGVRTADVCYF